MLSALYQLETAFSQIECPSKTAFYGIINNGFCESIQNQHAAKMLKLFCQRAGLNFGQVIAFGAGEMIRSMIEMNVPFGTASLAYLKEGWDAFVGHIVRQESAITVFCSPKMPTWLFRIIGNRTFWGPTAKKNGISRKEMCRKRIYSPEQ